MKKAIAIMVALAIAVLLVGGGYRQWTSTQEEVHEAADILRANGYAEDSPAILALQEVWHAEESNMQWVEIPEDIPEVDPETELAEPRYDDAELTPWEQFERLHPGKTCGEAGFWTLCNMLVYENGDAVRNGQYDLGAGIIVARGAVNRCVYGDEFPNDIVGVITQKNQYNPRYVTSYDLGFSEGVKQAVTYALTMDTQIPADISPTGEALDIPHSHFYHGQYLTGGRRWVSFTVTTSGGFTGSVVCGMDPSHCVE